MRKIISCIHSMNVSDLKNLLQKNEGVKILDVREKEEFEGSETIPGAENMPMGKVFLEASKGTLPKDQKNHYCVLERFAL
jgi:rhodanese-related sulfurtransferase